MAKRMNFYLTDVEVKRLNEMSKRTGLTVQRLLGERLMSIGRDLERKKRSEIVSIK